MDLSQLTSELEKIGAEAVQLAQGASSTQDIDDIKQNILGKKGRLTKVLRGMGQLPKDERPQVGQAANKVRDTIGEAVAIAESRIEHEARDRLLNVDIDMTLPTALSDLSPMGSHGVGALHPIVRTSEMILSVLDGLGFRRETGPQVEHDFYNFESLNFPADHPARDMQDTFFIEDDVILRTHTSPIQIRALMAQGEPPIRVSGYGAVFRHDQDNTHSPMFHQIEGLWIDQETSFAHLKGVMNTFLKELFGEQLRTRFRPSFFPFTEPSAEVDMSCFQCDGTGVAANRTLNNEHGQCKVCRGTGWVEILGCGMVDPNVINGVGLSSDVYRGFAFGVGVERVAMLRYGIAHIKDFYESDVRFLSQFVGQG